MQKPQIRNAVLYICWCFLEPPFHLGERKILPNFFHLQLGPDFNEINTVHSSWGHSWHFWPPCASSPAVHCGLEKASWSALGLFSTRVGLVRKQDYPPEFGAHKIGERRRTLFIWDRLHALCRWIKLNNFFFFLGTLGEYNAAWKEYHKTAFLAGFPSEYVDEPQMIASQGFAEAIAQFRRTANCRGHGIFYAVSRLVELESSMPKLRLFFLVSYLSCVLL